MMTEEFDFKLPKGLIDANGELHAQGKMRLLTAKDELIVQDLSSRDRNIDIVFLLLARLYEEVAFIAFYFHWSREDILNLTHAERLRWVNEIMRLR